MNNKKLTNIVIRIYMFYGVLVEPNLHEYNHYNSWEKIEQGIENQVLQAFNTGLQQDNNIQIIYHSLSESYHKCDVIVTFGSPKESTTRGRQIQQLIQIHKKQTQYGLHLIIEKGYIHRNRYYMIGWNGLNGRANFCNNNSQQDRWKHLDINIKPWRKDGKHILVCGQAPLDASIQDINFKEWCYETIEQIYTLTQRTIIYRPHPITYAQPNQKQLKNKFPYLNIVSNPYDIKLKENLKNCWCVVTINSNSGVEAIIQGIPVISQDIGSMVYNITDHELNCIEDPKIVDRTQWCNDIAYTQWTIEEMRKGLPWQHLKSYTLKYINNE